MSYVDEIIDKVIAQNPGQPEFHQTVKEVLDSLRPVVDANEAKYRREALLERMCMPERVIMFRVPWVDDKGQAQVNMGYRVQFNGAIGPYKGAQVVEAVKGSDIAVGAQDCATEAKGAYTGEIAASMIAALGCKYVILGHSERRQYYGETSETLNKKMVQAYANGLTPIYCVGESLEERKAGNHFAVCKAQIEEVVYNLTEEQFANLVIAYEPVWAIGTGETATAEQAQEIHAYIREVLAAKFGAAAAECPILYGGSCKPSNAAEIFAKEDVDGGLIGGAALKAEDFLAIGKGF